MPANPKGDGSTDRITAEQPDPGIEVTTGDADAVDIEPGSGEAKPTVAEQVGNGNVPDPPDIP